MTSTAHPAGTTSRTGIIRSVLALVAAVVWLGVPTVSAQPVFCENNGLIVLQFESAPPASGWAVETAEVGYTGSSYYRWNGGNQFFNPGQGVITYTLEVTTPGIYNMRIRNLHTDPDFTMENDCWTKMDGGPWIKTYSSLYDWNWSTFHESTNDKAEYFLDAGTHTFQVSGRSQNFRIDRVHFFIDGTQAPQGLFYDETLCGLWIELGGSVAGTGGLKPDLMGEGFLTSSSLTTLSLTNALPNTQSFLVIGFSPLFAPFKGGVMVPSVDVIIPGLPTGPAGVIEFDFTWANGAPTGVSLFWQYWIQDAGAVFGLSASNGLQSKTP